MTTEAPASGNPWDWIYATRAMDGVGWFEPDPFNSCELVDLAVARGGRSIIDVGGGASRLVDHLVDIALEPSRSWTFRRLASRSRAIDWARGRTASIG